MFSTIVSTIALLSVLVNQPAVTAPQEQVLGERSFSLDDRYSNKFVSDVFKDNILLDLAYLQGKVKDPSNINWDEVTKPFSYNLTLQPNEVFAFHDAVLPEYKDKQVVTTHAHFDSSEGFKSDGYLVADGVCHLASLINWAARDAQLDVKNPTNHDFAVIPDVPKQYGTAIYYMPGQDSSSELQNLYVTNNKNIPITLAFEYKDDTLSVKVVEVN